MQFNKIDLIHIQMTSRQLLFYGLDLVNYNIDYKGEKCPFLKRDMVLDMLKRGVNGYEFESNR